jgi:6-phosphogluconolactonase (cycloisomerase 2 family)
MSKRFACLALAAGCLSVFSSCGGHSNPSTNNMYVATQTSAQVWGYLANFNNGSLTGISGSPFAAQSAATAIVLDPAKTFAYVADSAPTNQIERFSVGANGALTAISGATPAGNNPVALAIDPGGKFLFVANQVSNNVSVFSVGASAALTEVPGSPFPVTAPVALAVPSTGNFLYVADQLDNAIDIFSFDSAGKLTAVGLPIILTSATAPSAIAINPAGTFLYVTNAQTNNVSGFTIATGAPTPGDLIPIAGSPFATGGFTPVSAAIDPSGQFLYVVDQGSNQLAGFRIAPVTGKLTAVANSPYNTGTFPTFVAISPSNKYLYVSNGGAATISGYSINPASGQLQPVSATTTNGTNPAGIAFGK